MPFYQNVIYFVVNRLFCSKTWNAPTKSLYLIKTNNKNMTDDKKQQLQQRMDALHDKYCNQLPDKYQEIEDSWKEYQTDINNPDLLDTFYRLVHTFKGTAATFGFIKQSDVCFEIQKLLIDAKENHKTLTQDVITVINKLLANFKEIINTPAKGNID